MEGSSSVDPRHADHHADARRGADVVDGDGVIGYECRAQQREHLLPRRALAVSAELEAERQPRDAVKQAYDFAVEHVRWPPEARADVMATQECQVPRGI